MTTIFVLCRYAVSRVTKRNDFEFQISNRSFALEQIVCGKNERRDHSVWSLVKWRNRVLLRVVFGAVAAGPGQPRPGPDAAEPGTARRHFFEHSSWKRVTTSLLVVPRTSAVSISRPLKPSRTRQAGHVFGRSCLFFFPSRHNAARTITGDFSPRSRFRAHLSPSDGASAPVVVVV